MEPYVNDLLKLWDGVELNIPALKCKKKIRCALLSVSCDLPAGRKVGGFLSHNAHLGCSRCLKKFSGGVGCPFLPSRTNSGSVFDTLCAGSGIQQQPSDNHNYWTCDSSVHNIVIPSYSSRHTLAATQKDHLMELYSELYSTSRSSVEISAVCMRYTHVSMHGKQLGAHRSRMASSSVVMVTWNGTLFGVSESCVIRAARINYFCKHVAVINGHHKSHLLANFSWFKYHPKNDNFGKPVTVWYHDLFESCGIYSMIPIQFIESRSVSVIDKLDGESVLFVTPLIDF